MKWSLLISKQLKLKLAAEAKLLQYVWCFGLVLYVFLLMEDMHFMLSVNSFPFS